MRSGANFVIIIARTKDKRKHALEKILKHNYNKTCNIHSGGFKNFVQGGH